MPDPLSHLFVDGFTESRNFKSTLSIRKQPPPARDRQTHGHALLSQIADLRKQEVALNVRRAELQLPEAVGMTLAIEVEPSGALDVFKQLEWRRDGIEILSVVQAGSSDIVALHVPDGHLSALERRIDDYLRKNAEKSGKPRNASLVNAIAAIRKAAFDELWTDERAEPPEANALTWFQVWLRRGNDTAQHLRNRFAQQAAVLGIHVDSGWVSFPGRVVIAVQAKRSDLEKALELLDSIAEIQSVATTAAFFIDQLKPHEQAEWVSELAAKTTHPDANNATYITLMDTGVAQAHPLLQPSLDVGDMHAVDPAWQASDHEGHGTEMAGTSLHGDLTPLLSAIGPHALPHRLESVKIHPPFGFTPPHLYGWVIEQATGIVESIAPDRRRLFAMMTTAVGQTSGMPTEWSAAIDRLAYGLAPGSDSDLLPTVELRPRLMVLSAGNVPVAGWDDYPSINDTTAIESPAQAWNALTVGASTRLLDVDKTMWPKLTPLAESGALSPSSTTSVVWKRAWPFKPDVVAEGGNGSSDGVFPAVAGPTSLRILTTAHNLAVTTLAETGGTSAAAAEVARIAAHLSAHYPQLWPESIRALVVHGAQYSSVMRGELPIAPLKKDKELLLRRYGYGIADLARSLTSTEQRATMVLQEHIRPYKLEGSQVQLGEMNLHQLPWPTQQLEELGGATVEMRVTLSYFVQPNPSSRGWMSKFRYQSHGLRFAVKGSTEDDHQFIRRINQLEREEYGEGEVLTDPDVANWFLGAQMRARGCLHSDIWRGTGSQLAAKSQLAVFPVGGWWKDWKEAQRQNSEVRYSLVVSLNVLEDIAVDLYTPIANVIAAPVAVGI